MVIISNTYIFCWPDSKVRSRKLIAKTESIFGINIYHSNEEKNIIFLKKKATECGNLLGNYQLDLKFDLLFFCHSTTCE